MTDGSEMLEMKMLVQREPNITGFSFAFASLLWKRLQKLVAEQQVKGIGKQWCDLSPEAAAVVNHLNGQIFGQPLSESTDGGIRGSDFDRLYEATPKFIKIFEEK